MRVLGGGWTGSGRMLIAGLRWAIEQGIEVVNMSLSTTKRELAAVLHELADHAYFNRTLIVAAAHNMPVESYPWRFSSVLSVGSHELEDPEAYFYNPTPPVEFFARGVEVEVPWLGGSTVHSTGNSFATPHIAGMCARIRSKHPELTAVPGEERAVLDRQQRRRQPWLRPSSATPLPAGVLAAEAGQRELLQSIVEVARAIFGARASSIFVLDEEADELVFEAVAGEGADTVHRAPDPVEHRASPAGCSSRASRSCSSDVSQDPRFARDVAEATGYVPESLMAVPLLHGERVLGVLQVLDRPQDKPFSLSEMDLLGLFAHQAAIALDVLGRARRARAVVEGDSLAVVSRLAATLDALPPDRREAGLELLAALERAARSLNEARRHSPPRSQPLRSGRYDFVRTLFP